MNLRDELTAQARNILAKYDGMTMHDYLLAASLAKLDTLQETILKQQFERGSLEMEAGYNQSQESYNKRLDCYLDLLRPDPTPDEI